LIVLSLVGAPAVILRVLCVGSSCDANDAQAQAAVPFCSLPVELRRGIVAGFREGRSPDVMAAADGPSALWTGVHDGVRVPWPGAARGGDGPALPDTRVPIVFFGAGVERGRLPGNVGLDAIAPTLEGASGIRRDHPEVRTGEAIDGVTSDGPGVPLVVVIAWKGLGAPDLEAKPGAWPFLRRAMRDGAGTLEAVTGSLPLDPAATLTTIGTGALPSSHGITGTLVRTDEGAVQRAWSAGGAGSVIATFADDIDHDSGERARVAAVLTDPADRGIVGNGWYLDAGDRDTVTELGREQHDSATTSGTIVSADGLGRDEITDVLGIVLDGTVAEVDGETADVVATIRDLVPGATFVVAGTGSLRGSRGTGSGTFAASVDAALQAPIVEATAADGFFLDRDVLVERSLTAQQAADVLGRERSRDGKPRFADVYPSFAVAFSRYC
jgi:hypothetical protein